MKTKARKAQKVQALLKAEAAYESKRFNVARAFAASLCRCDESRVTWRDIQCYLGSAERALASIGIKAP